MSKKAKFVVYMLVDPRDGRPYYIGETTDKKKRYRYHSENSGRNTAVARHNQTIIRAGKKPFMVELDSADNEVEALRKELFWIDLLLGRGCDLANRENQAWLYERFNEQVTVARLERPPAPATGKASVSRHGKRWNDDERVRLQEAYESGRQALLQDLAKLHGRGMKAIELQLQQMMKPEI